MNEFDNEFENKKDEQLSENISSEISDGSALNFRSAENSSADKTDSETAEASGDKSGEKSDDKEAEDEKPFSNVIYWVCSMVFTAAVIIMINIFLFHPITVDGTSMCDTLQDKDLVITTSVAYEPKFGDIVVIQANKLVNGETGLYGEPIIKRVIGTEGDVIRFDLKTGGVYRNGELLDEDYIIGPTNQTYNGWVESETDYVVPKDCVFVMGDNRKVSHDSRDLKIIGFVNKNYIMGKALFRLYPLNEMKLL